MSKANEVWSGSLSFVAWNEKREQERGRGAWGTKTPTCVFSLGAPRMTSDCWTTNVRCLWTFLSAYNWRETLQSGIRSNISIKFHHETLDFIKYILSAIIFMVSSFCIMDYIGLGKWIPPCLWVSEEDALIGFECRICREIQLKRLTCLWLLWTFVKLFQQVTVFCFVCLFVLFFLKENKL